MPADSTGSTGTGSTVTIRSRSITRSAVVPGCSVSCAVTSARRGSSGRDEREGGREPGRQLARVALRDLRIRGEVHVRERADAAEHGANRAGERDELVEGELVVREPAGRPEAIVAPSCGAGLEERAPSRSTPYTASRAASRGRRGSAAGGPGGTTSATTFVGGPRRSPTHASSLGSARAAAPAGA